MPFNIVKQLSSRHMLVTLNTKYKYCSFTAILGQYRVAKMGPISACMYVHILKSTDLVLDTFAKFLNRPYINIQIYAHIYIEPFRPV